MNQYLNCRIVYRANGSWFRGKVIGSAPFCLHSPPKWRVALENGTTINCNESDIKRGSKLSVKVFNLDSVPTMMDVQPSKRSVTPVPIAGVEEVTVPSIVEPDIGLPTSTEDVENSLHIQSPSLLDNINNDNVSGDLDYCEVRPSSIPGVGLGLFAKKFIPPCTRITKYSGKVISHDESSRSNSSYIMYVNKKHVWMTRAPATWWSDTLTMVKSLSGLTCNARFGASRCLYTCKISGRKWIPIISTMGIQPGEEILAPYGSLVVWKNLPSVPYLQHPQPDPDQNNGHDTNNDGDRPLGAITSQQSTQEKLFRKGLRSI